MIRRICIVHLFVIANYCVFTPIVRAEAILFGLSGQQLGTSINTVDPSAGTTVNVGNFGGFSRPELYGLASRPNDDQYLYSIDENSRDPQLVRIDTTFLSPGGFAVAEDIGNGFDPDDLGVSSQNFIVDSIAISPLAPDIGVFSALSGPFSSLSRSIFRANMDTGDILGPAAGLSTLSATSALTYILDGSTLYGALGTNLYTIDPLTGTQTLVGNSGVSLTALAFNQNNGLLYGAKGSGGSNLYTVSTSDGSLTDVAAWPTFTINPEGFAFLGNAVPEPSSLSCVLILLSYLGGRRSRRQN